MSTTMKQIGFVFLALAVAAALVVSGGALRVPQAAAQDTPASTITVMGFGEANGAPDVATVMLGVDKLNEDLSVVMSEADAVMTAVSEALAALGIPAEDIQTMDFSVWSEDRMGPDGMLQAAPQYRMVNTVRIRVMDTELVQAVIDAGVTAGANRIQGVSFGLDDLAALESEARVDALADARERAEQIAAAIGVTLGDPIVVNEGGSPGLYGMEAAVRGIGGGGGIQQGQLSVSVQVQVTFDVVR